ncbi:hypothetical protein [Bradyrhizobium sp. USDA 3650]
MRVDYCQVEAGSFLLPDARQDSDTLELDFQRGLRRVTLVVAHIYVMRAFDAGLFHLGCNRMAVEELQLLRLVRDFAKDQKKRQDFVEQIEAMAEKEQQPEFKPAS